MGSYTIPP